MANLFPALAALVVASAACHAQVSVATQHNDIARSGRNTSETILTPANVNGAGFGKLFSALLDGVAYAQPLYLQNVAIPGKGSHNVVFVATENDSVYALDADTNGGVSGVPLWRANLAAAAHGALPGATAVPVEDILDAPGASWGITGTPVIDSTRGIIFAVSFALEGSSFVSRLHALDVKTGDEEPGSPVAIQASVPGTGNGSAGGRLTFDPKWEMQRSGLLLMHGVLYVAFGAFGDNGPWHGWLFAYNETSLAQMGAYCVTPNGVGGGLWMAGAGLAGDTDDPAHYPSGRIFAVAGNGDFDAASANQNGADYGDSVLNLSLQAGALKIGDSFTPHNQAALDAADGDLGSGGAVVVPDKDSATPLLIVAGKEGTIYLLDRNSLGAYHPVDQVVQELANGQTSTSWGAGLWGLPAYWNKTLYFPGRNSPLQAFSLENGLLSTKPVSQTAESLVFPAPPPSVSANGNTHGIVWLLESIHPDTPNAVLEAYDAANLQNLLYSSLANPARDTFGTGVKFSIPTVANGKVYASSIVTDQATGAVYGQLTVFGLLDGVVPAQPPVFQPAAGRIATPALVAITDSTPNAVIYYTTDGSIPTAASAQYNGPITVAANETITAIASAPSFLQSASVSATYTSASQVYDPVVSPASGFFTNSVPVTITDQTPHARIFYTLNGSTPTSSSTLYTGPFKIQPADTSQITLKVAALSPAGLAPALAPSDVVAEQYEIAVEGTSIDCSITSTQNDNAGFSGPLCAMTRNGSSPAKQENDTRLELTTGSNNQAGSAFSNRPVDVASFQTDFSFQLSNPVSQGMAFVLQGNSPTAMGSEGIGFGYTGIDNSVALFFDFYQTNSIGLLVDGAAAQIGASASNAASLDPSLIDLSSGDTMVADLAYYKDSLAVTLTDTVTGKSWATSYQVDIITHTASGGAGPTSAYAGFTGGTNGAGSSSQKILSWTYEAGTPPVAITAMPALSPAPGTYTGTQRVSISDATANAVIYYTTDGSQPTTASRVYAGPIAVTSTETIQAIARAPNPKASAAGQPANLVVSPPLGATYTITQ